MEDRLIDRLAKALGETANRRKAIGGLVPAAFGMTAGAGPTQAVQCRRVSEKKVRRYIKSAARKYKQPYKKMLCVAQCESWLDNCAVNEAGRSYGLYQFIESTWRDQTLNPKYYRKNYWDPKWASLATAEMWSRGLSSHWDCCCPHWGCGCPGQDPPWC